MWAVSQKRAMIRKFLQLRKGVSLSHLAISSALSSGVDRFSLTCPCQKLKKNVEGYRIGYRIASYIPGTVIGEKL